METHNRKSRNLIVFVLGLQALTLAGQWLGGPGIISPAQAQIANPGADRAEMIEQVKATNAKLDQLIGILQGGKLQVVVTSTDDGKDGNANR